MYGALQTALFVLAISSPALLLVGRFARPKRVPWWVVVVATALVSTLLGYTLDEIGWYAHVEETERCMEGEAFFTPGQGCRLSYHVARIPMYLKWLPGIAILACLLPIYFLTWWLHSRRHQVPRANNSCERTREG